MKKVGITAIGEDHEGIVAAFTNFVFAKGGNIETIHQNVVRGLFGMYVEASFQDLDYKEFGVQIRKLGKEQGMDVSTYHATATKKNIAIFVTKEPHCLEAILADAKSGRLSDQIVVVVGTEDTLRDQVQKEGIPFVVVRERNQEKADVQLLAICEEYRVDLIVLARYMRILTPNFVWRYPRRIINIHPSLLPAFPGAFAYQQAFERGTKIVGVTSHYVTENLDQGPIILQESFGVKPDDTLRTIKSKGQRLEADTLSRAVRLHLENRLEVHWRKVSIKQRQ